MSCEIDFRVFPGEGLRRSLENRSEEVKKLQGSEVEISWAELEEGVVFREVWKRSYRDWECSSDGRAPA